ncbi:MAG: hypothetical protein EPN23_03210 [Verrucomicrobia bacterium]|nr:MAG: hypothetical protein EPN23_03210 [Verrucomicrobiota bacterium]
MRRFTSIFIVFVAAAALASAVRLNPRLTTRRVEQHLVPAAPTETMPPLLAFTTVTFGGFRGLAADLLWLRATDLQERGEYFELVQIADWITKLEPRFTSVWAFQAWNMAYNISVLLNDPAERWRWVRAGVSLLRDNGLRYNPGSAGLHYELAWLFFHKLGQGYDQAHLFYKRAWAEEMTALFGGAQPDYARLLADPERLRVLREVYKLDPTAMQRVDAAYGPLDWRLPDAHAIYWAVQGKSYAKAFDDARLDRMIFQALADAFKHGRLLTKLNEAEFTIGPNLDLLPRVDAQYLATARAYPNDDTIKTSHANFLKEAVVMLYRSHRHQAAGACLTELAKLYPATVKTNNLDAFVAEVLAAQARAGLPVRP